MPCPFLCPIDKNDKLSGISGFCHAILIIGSVQKLVIRWRQKFCEFSMTTKWDFFYTKPTLLYLFDLFFSLSRLIIVMKSDHIWPRATPQLTMSRLCDCSGFMPDGHFLYSQIIAQLNSGHDPHCVLIFKKTLL